MKSDKDEQRSITETKAVRSLQKNVCQYMVRYLGALAPCLKFSLTPGGGGIDLHCWQREPRPTGRTADRNYDLNEARKSSSSAVWIVELMRYRPTD